MAKQEILNLLMLLAALESWGFSTSQRLPDYLIERIDESVERLSKEMLK